jgi:hypothetical protein
MHYLGIAVAMASDAPVRKDVVVATIGASAALGGLALVSLAMVFTALPLDSNLALVVTRIVTRLAFTVLAGFATCIADIGVGLAWLALPGGSVLYDLNIVLFVVELAGIFLVVAAAITALVNLSSAR